MAHIRCDFRSEVMEMGTSMTVVLPEGAALEERPVVYLLHGLEDNCTGWTRYTSVERYAREHQAALVIPEVQRSWYADMRAGLPYFRFVHEELPEICRRIFRFSDAPEKNYVMGLSMGGYAALKCALHTPERYAGVAAFSAVTDLPGRVARANEMERCEFDAVFGPGKTVPTSCDLFVLAKERDGRKLPRLYLACGRQDALCPDVERFATMLEERGAPVCFESWDGGHEWSFWDSAVKAAFDYMWKGGGA